MAVLLIAAAASAADNKPAVLAKMDTGAAHYGDVSRKIWEFAEVGYKENKSAALLKSELRAGGISGWRRMWPASRRRSPPPGAKASR